MRRTIGIGSLIVAGLSIAVALVLIVSPFASSSPDGLEKVAADHRLDTEATTSPAADGPLAGYTVRGVDHPRVSTALSGLIGVAATFVSGLGLFAILHRRRGPTAPT